MTANKPDKEDKMLCWEYSLDQEEKALISTSEKKQPTKMVDISLDFVENLVRRFQISSKL
jgi:hypothetical protein